MTSSAVTPFQIAVARGFFSLPESETFLLAGGAALLATGLIARPTLDLDLFTSKPDRVEKASEAFVAYAQLQGWQVDIWHSGPSFARMLVRDREEVFVDLALDSAPHGQPNATFLGPTLSPDELASRKLLALFGRALPRDFEDIYAMRDAMDFADLMRAAKEIDPGFEVKWLIIAIKSLKFLADDLFTLPSDEILQLRAYFDNLSKWLSRL